MKSEVIRFAFTIEHGENAGLSSGGWRLWVNGDTTYITAKPLGNTWKVSLHGETAWRVASPKENYLSEDPIWSGENRALWEFEPTPFHDGRRLAFVIAMCRHALLPMELSVKDVHISVNDAWDECTKAEVWMTEPGVELGIKRVIGGPLVLDGGRQVWLTASTEAVKSGEAGPQAVGAIIQPLTPENDGVPAPGFLVAGAHLG
jgi:hypothetical protein